MNFETIAASIGLSGLIAAIVSGVISSLNSKNEREFSLLKEEYYLLQQKAEQIFGYMYQYDQIINMMFGQLKRKALSLTVINAEIETLKKYKQLIYEIIHVYFWDKSASYNEYSEAIGEIFDIYFNVAKNNLLTDADTQKLKESFPKLREKQFEFTEKILSVIKAKRLKLIKKPINSKIWCWIAH